MNSERTIFPSFTEGIHSTNKEVVEKNHASFMNCILDAFGKTNKEVLKLFSDPEADPINKIFNEHYDHLLPAFPAFNRTNNHSGHCDESLDCLPSKFPIPNFNIPPIYNCLKDRWGLVKTFENEVVKAQAEFIVCPFA